MSDENELVLDNCMGSGSTCVAAVNTNRHYIGFELDNKYFDIACKRLDEAEEKLGGGKFIDGVFYSEEEMLSYTE